MSLLKRLLPRDRSDQFAFGCAFFLITLITVYELSTLRMLYQLHGGASLSFMVVFAIGIFILVNVVANMFYTILTDASVFTLSSKLPVVLLEDWRYCSVCEVNCPPRSFHCHACNKCVLKRLNHCMFLGKCAGYANARYYYAFLIYTWLATLYCNFLNAEYIIDLMHEFSFKTVFVTLMPLLAWMFGVVDNIRLLTVFVNTTCLLTFFILFFYLILNLKLVQSGQTWFEKANNIHFHASNKANMADIFGTNWFLTLLVPFVKHQLPGDGTHFKLSKRPFEDLKNI